MSGGKNGSRWGQRGSRGTFGLKSYSSLEDFRKSVSYIQWKPLVVYLFVCSKWSDLIIFVFLKKVILAAEWEMDWKFEGQDRRGPREMNQRAIITLVQQRDDDNSCDLSRGSGCRVPTFELFRI